MNKYHVIYERLEPEHNILDEECEAPTAEDALTFFRTFHRFELERGEIEIIGLKPMESSGNSRIIELLEEIKSVLVDILAISLEESLKET